MSETVTTGTPNLNKALSQLQGELPKVTKGNEGKITYEGKDGREGGSYKYKYADLSDVTAAVGPLLAKYGLAFHCAPTIDPADRRLMILSWSLLHESGEEKAGEWPLGLANQKPQSLGSAITYGRRYCLSAATGIVAEDDDDGQRSQNDHGSRQSAAGAFEAAAPAPPRQNGSDGNGQRRQPARAAQDEPQAAGTGNPWLDGALKAAPGLATAEACDVMWRKSVQMVTDKTITRADAAKVQALLTSRKAELKTALAPDDSWAAAFRDAADATEAERLLADLRDQAGRGEVDPGRAALVEQAAEELFPGITVMEAAA